MISSTDRRAKCLSLCIIALATTPVPAFARTFGPIAGHGGECEMIALIAKRSPEVSNGVGSVRLVDLYGYLPRCDWKKLGLSINEEQGLSMAFQKPRLKSDGEGATVGVTIPHEYGGSDFECDLVRDSRRWRIHTCRSFQEAPNHRFRLMVEMSKKAGEGCAGGSATLKSGGSVERMEDYRCDPPEDHVRQ